MKKVYFILLVLTSMLFSFCKNYEKPVLVLPQKTDTLPIVTSTIDNNTDVTNNVNAYFTDSTNKFLNFNTTFNDKKNTYVYFRIPFYAKVAKYRFITNKQATSFFIPDHYFYYQNNDYSKDTCLNYIPFSWGLSPYFAEVSIDEIILKNNKYIFSGSFSLYLIRKCDSGSDTLFVKDATFKNVTIL